MENTAKIWELTNEVMEDDDESDVYELLNSTKDFAERHIAVIKERLQEKLLRAQDRHK